MQVGDSQVRVTVKCFGAVKELVSVAELEVTVSAGTTVEGVFEQLAEEAPKLRELAVAFAVNLSYANRDLVLADGDEVAFIPPISGGASDDDACGFELTHEPLDPRVLEQAVRTDADGAVAVFAGTTRNHNEGDAVVSLYYEAYEEMAHKVMRQLFDQAMERFEITRARVAHRLGSVPVGSTSVLVAVASPHRGAAFEACRFLIDQLKDEVPIFKREQLRGDGGQTRWIGDLPKPPE